MALSANDVANYLSAKFTNGGIPVAASDILAGTVDPNIKDVIRQLLLQWQNQGIVLPALVLVP